MIEKLLVIGLFIPCSKMLASIFVTISPAEQGLYVGLTSTQWPWALYAGISAVAGLFLVILAAVVSLIQNDLDLDSRDIDAHPHGRCHLGHLAVRAGLVVVPIIFSNSQFISSLLVFALMILEFCGVFIFQPFIRPLLNQLLSGFFFSAAVASLGSLINHSVGQDEDFTRLIASATLLAISVLLAPIGFFLTKFRFIQLIALREHPNPQFRFPTDVEIACRFMRVDRSDVAIQDMVRLFKKGSTVFIETSFVDLCCAFAVQKYTPDTTTAGDHFRSAWQRSPYPDMRYALYNLRKQWETTAKEQTSGQQEDIFGSLENKRLYEAARQCHNSTLRCLKFFWKSLLKKDLAAPGALDQVPKKLAEISSFALQAETAYKRLVVRFPASKILLRSYGAFLQNCMNDITGAQAQFSKADEVEEQEASHRLRGSEAGTDGVASSKATSESASLTSSSAASSAAGRRSSNRAHKLEVKSAEVAAVKRLHYGIVFGLLALCILSATTFITVTEVFKLFSESLYRMRVASFQRRRAVAVSHFVRTMQLNALAGNVDNFVAMQALVLDRATSFQSDHFGLYFGFSDVPASTDAAITAFWKEVNVVITKYFPGPPVYRQVKKLNLWDVGNLWVLSCKKLAVMNVSLFLDAPHVKEVRFMWDNSIFNVLDVLNQAARLYTQEVTTVVMSSKIGMGSVLAVCMLTLVIEALFVFRPAFKKVQETLSGVDDIINVIPRGAIKEVYRRVGKAKQLDNQSDDSASSDGENNEEGKDPSRPTSARGEPHLQDVNGATEGAGSGAVSPTIKAAGTEKEHNLQDFKGGTTTTHRFSIGAAGSSDSSEREGKVLKTSDQPEHHHRGLVQRKSRVVKHESETKREGSHKGRHAPRPSAGGAADAPHRKPSILKNKHHPHYHTEEPLVEVPEAKKEDSDHDEKKKKAQAPEKRQSSQEEKVDVFRPMTRKYLAAFTLIALATTGNFVFCYIYVDMGNITNAEVDYAGARRMLAREVMFVGRELYINDDNVLSRADLFTRLRNTIQRFYDIHQGLKFGNNDMGLPGANGRYRPQDNLMYRSGCLRLLEKDCIDGRVDDMEIISNGLDALIMAFLDLGTEMILETAPDLLVNGTEWDDSLIIKNRYVLPDSEALRTITQIDNGDLDDGLARSATLIVEEAESRNTMIQMVEAIILALNVFFLLCLYMFLFRPMVVRLREESGRTSQLLRMFPPDVVQKLPQLHHYFIGLAQED